VPKTVEDAIEQLLDELPFEQVIGWANIYNVPHDEETWFDDEWPDKEGELRVQVAAAMLKAQEKK